MSLLRRLGNTTETGPLSTDRSPDTTETQELGGATRPPQLAQVLKRPQMRAPSQHPSTDDTVQQLKARIQNRIIAELDPRMDLSDEQRVRRTLEETFLSVLESEGIALSRIERHRLFEAIVAEILGYGPIEPLLKDDTVTEIMVNGPKQVWVERGGKLEKTSIQFDDDEHVMRIIDRIVSPLGRRIDESSPMVDARLPDGSRINAVIPPISLVGPCLTIRKFSRDPLTVDDLIRFGTMTPEIAQFLKACVEVRLNIVVSGGTGSGKTTLLNVLSSFIPGDERIVTIENAAELQLRQEHVVTLESRPPNIEGKARSRSATWSLTRCGCGRIGSWLVSVVAAKRSTCSKP